MIGNRGLRYPRSRSSALRLEPLEDRKLLSATAWSSYGRDAQHTADSTVAGQPLGAIHWQTPVDSAPQYSGNDLLIHYGSPIATVNNTLIVPEKNEATGGFDLKAFDGATGALKWTQTEGEEFLPPAHDWTPSYSPAVAALPGGATRLYFPGAGGTILYRDSPDSNGAVAAGRIAFYDDATNSHYNANPAAFADIRIASPLTVDGAGNLYFTFRVVNSNPLGVQSGIARIGADGSKTFAYVGTPALDSAPAVSNDGSKLYVAIGTSLLVEYNSTTLAQIAQVTTGFISVDSSASPTVGPDGDVYFGVLSPSVHARGSLQHFSGDLSTTYVSGSFGWDDTVSIVPASMVPSYGGPSSYLLMTKYNDYAGASGSGINKIAIVDPKTTQIDPVTGSPAMATVLSIAGVTPDDEFPTKPAAVREWCINNAVVDPATHSIFANSEDGWLYRWDTFTDTFTQRIQLTDGVGEAYTPTMMGPDGTVYAINNATLFAIGASSVTGRALFYDNSKYDGNVAGISASDGAAIASDKTAYLPGASAATFAAVSSYAKGINGVMVDLQGSHPDITAADFVFKVGNNNAPAAWNIAPPPIGITVLPGSSGSDRVELVWAEGAIQNKWLEVIVKGTDRLTGNVNHTGLATSDVFFFGSATGDTGAGDTSAAAVVSGADVTAVQANQATPSANIPATNLYDINRDGQVSGADVTLVQTHQTTNSTALKWILIPPAGGPGGFASLPAAAPGNSDDSHAVIASGLAVALSTVTRPLDPPTGVAGAAETNRGPDSNLLARNAADGLPRSWPALSDVETVAAAADCDDDLLDLLAAQSEAQ